MNDVLIIVICIFFMSILWSFYFKRIKEGVDNYVMPVSFSDNSSTDPSKDESKTIHVPEKIKTNNDLNLNLMNNTNVEGALNVKTNSNLQGPLDVTGETKLKSKLTVTGDTTLNKLNVTGDTILNKLNVTGDTSLNKLNVTGDTSLGKLNVRDNLITPSLDLGGLTLDKNSLGAFQSSGIKGIQFGICSGDLPYKHPDKTRKNWNLIENDYGYLKFDNEFGQGQKVYVFTTRNGGDTYSSIHPHECSKIGLINIFDVTHKGFKYRTSNVNDKGGFQCYFSRGLFPFFWFAIAS